MYNSEKYSVSHFMIFSPSLHLFNEKKVAAEVIVEHIPENGGDNLFVCVPIINLSDTTNASILLSEIIAGVAANAPADCETANLNLADFTLNKIIPKAPFFSYTGSYNNASANFIVFGLNHAIPLNDKVLNVLNSIIKPFKLPMFGDNLFYNEKGSNSVNHIGDGIYISCQPTGSSEEQTDITNTKSGSSSSSSNDLGDIFDSKAFKIIIKIIFACIFFGIIFASLAFAYNKLKNNKTITGAANIISESVVAKDL
jgi:hypothetical protein